VLPIQEVAVETPSVKTFYVKYPEIASTVRPGQFVMVWVIGVDEIPIAVSDAKGDGTIGLTIARVGDATTHLHQLRNGDMIGIRGPYGNWFDLSGSKIIMVGGGYGIAPLAFCAKVALAEGKKVKVILGARSADELVLLNTLKKLGTDLSIATEDGTAGLKGLVTDALERVLEKERYDSCMTCGPEKMMKKVVEMTELRGIRTQVSLERYMKCGIGVCGQCCVDPLGIRVCTEGPVFYPEQLKGPEFGNYARDAAGLKKGLG
jgi:dihydroorotate dehydrogenase electron transfer subunit